MENQRHVAFSPLLLQHATVPYARGASILSACAPIDLWSLETTDLCARGSTNLIAQCLLTSSLLIPVHQLLSDGET